VIAKKRIAFVHLFTEASSSTVVSEEIHVAPSGAWQHPVYGEMEITPVDIAEFVQNFSRGFRLDIPITAGHDNGLSGGENTNGSRQRVWEYRNAKKLDC
jgi:hypothetical protein